jgi:hypothetical protein
MTMNRGRLHDHAVNQLLSEQFQNRLGCLIQRVNQIRVNHILEKPDPAPD